MEEPTEHHDPVLAPIDESPKPTRRRRVYQALGSLLIMFVAGLVLAAWWVHALNEPPTDFPVMQPVTIESGTDTRDITEILQSKNVVQSSALLYFFITFLHDPTDVKASTYVFEEPLTAQAVATRLTEGDFDTNLIRFVHFEGERADILAERAAEVLPEFDAETFIAEATPHEGRLFPDTYFIPLTFTETELRDLLVSTYEERIEPLRPAIATHPLTEMEVLTLASIVEREANTTESMRMVAGILQNRLEIDMPLQADATIEYTLKTPLGELPPEELAESLQEIDSPYNTYRYSGLPPTPIGNPGLESIAAVLEPTESEYLFYITGNDGNFYYATTFAEHQRNIERYLR